MVPGARALLEFAHPAFAIIGLGFWLGYTFVHYRPLGWIAFGLVTATIGLGLTWFAANTRAARRGPSATASHRTPPSHKTTLRTRPGRPSAPASSPCTAGRPR